MKARMSFSLRAWLCIAAALLIVTPTIAIVAQTFKGPSVQSARKASRNGVPWPEQKEPSPTATLKSAVQRELDALYAERGYKAPTMTVEQALTALKKAKVLPTSSTPTRTAAARPAPAPRDLLVAGTQKTSAARTQKKERPLAELLSRAPLPKIRFLRLGSADDESKSAQQPLPLPAQKQAAAERKDRRTESPITRRPTKAAPRKGEIQCELDALYARRGYKAPTLTTKEALNALRKAKALPSQDSSISTASSKDESKSPVPAASQKKRSSKKTGGLDLLAGRAKQHSQKSKKTSSGVQLTKAEQPAKPTKAGTQAAADSEIQKKYRKIAQRRSLIGMKGFCPVVLRDSRELVDVNKQFASVYHSKTYYFSSKAAKAKFDRNPERYAPAADGHDVVLLKKTGERHEGSLEHAVWYRDRLYLFTSKVTMETFMTSASKYAMK